jgi:ectoine hydroxylase-related dioxygenase (phytanoyl-CoA dioxygenase family)
VPGAFSAGDAAEIESWTAEIAALPEESGKHWVFHETSQIDPGTDLICRIEKVAPFHPGFEQITRALAGPVGQLLGEDAVLFKEKINFKMPGGDGFKPHQDSQAGWEDYAKYFITAMICIDEATFENGCLQVVAGYQNRGLFRLWEPLNDEDMAGMEFTPAPTNPGDVLLFDSYAPHYSEPNQSDKTRRLYFATYNKSSEGDHYDQYHADKYKSFPPDIDRDPDREYVYRV